MEDGDGDEDGGWRRRQGWRTVPETNPVNRAENENEGQLWRRGRRTVPETEMENGDVYRGGHLVNH